MNLILKTLLLIPIILLAGSLFYAILFGVLFVSYFVGILMMPTKLYGYLKELEHYKRIKK